MIFCYHEMSNFVIYENVWIISFVEHMDFMLTETHIHPYTHINIYMHKYSWQQTYTSIYQHKNTRIHTDKLIHRQTLRHIHTHKPTPRHTNWHIYTNTKPDNQLHTQTHISESHIYKLLMMMHIRGRWICWYLVNVSR